MDQDKPVASLVARPGSLLVFSEEAYADRLHCIEPVETEIVGERAPVLNLEVCACE